METVLVAAIILGLIPAAIAKSKGRSFLGWWAYGFAIWIVAIIHSIVIKPTGEALERDAKSRGLARCPECREWIQRDATKCRFCNADLHEQTSSTQLMPPLATQQPNPKESRSRQILILTLFITAGLLILVVTIAFSGDRGSSAPSNDVSNTTTNQDSPASAAQNTQGNDTSAANTETSSAPDQSGQSSSAPTADGDSQSDNAPEYLKINAVDLYQAYQNNEVAADQEYKGNSLLVVGDVASINKDFLNEPYLSLAAPDEFSTVEAYLKQGQTSKAASLNKGQKVQLLCEGDGMTLGIPVVNHCVIEQP